MDDKDFSKEYPERAIEAPIANMQQDGVIPQAGMPQAGGAIQAGRVSQADTDTPINTAIHAGMLTRPAPQTDFDPRMAPVYAGPINPRTLVQSPDPRMQPPFQVPDSGMQIPLQPAAMLVYAGPDMMSNRNGFQQGMADMSTWNSMQNNVQSGQNAWNTQNSDDNEEKVFCEMCGCKIPAKGKFCPECGTVRKKA